MIVRAFRFRVLALLAAAALGMGLLVLVPMKPAEAAFPGQNGKIAFVSDRVSNSEIYTMNADGTGQTNITDHLSFDEYPEYSADGKRIIFVRNAGSIYVMNSDGSNQTLVDPWNGADLDSPTWSPDGTKIALAGHYYGEEETFHQIYTMNADGSDQTNISNNRAARDYSPDWQPLPANTAPTITSLRPPPGSTTDRTPTIAATLTDQQTDLAKANITLSLDGQTIPRAAFSYNRSTDRLTYTPDKKLSVGRHNVRVIAKDEANLSTTKNWGFEIVHP